jgi:hypothetical protein
MIIMDSYSRKMAKNSEIRYDTVFNRLEAVCFFIVSGSKGENPAWTSDTVSRNWTYLDM